MKVIDTRKHNGYVHDTPKTVNYFDGYLAYESKAIYAAEGPTAGWIYSLGVIDGEAVAFLGTTGDFNPPEL